MGFQLQVQKVAKILSKCGNLDKHTQKHPKNGFSPRKFNIIKKKMAPRVRKINGKDFYQWKYFVKVISLWWKMNIHVFSFVFCFKTIFFGKKWGKKNQKMHFFDIKSLFWLFPKKICLFRWFPNLLT